MKIGKTTIGPGEKTFVIAELSANHNQDKAVAIETVKAAKRAGADAIKLQTYTPDTITIDVKNDFFKIDQDTIWDGRYLYDLYKEAFTPWEWHEELFSIAANEGLECFSSPFDFSAVDFLESLNTPAYKIASFEITDIPLIQYVASKGKPLIISTGIANLDDIENALDACVGLDKSQIALLKCTSSYPAPLSEANLTMIKDITDRFGVVSGLSDHTLGITAPMIAVAFGAQIIEKHFILDRTIGGPDASFSLDEKQFKEMVGSVREAESSIGKVSYELTAKMVRGRQFSRSLFVVEDVKNGDLITEKNVRSIRPGNGLHPKHFGQIIGKRFAQDLTIGTPLEMKFIEL